MYTNHQFNSIFCFVFDGHNRLLETDMKSLNSLHSNHSRRSSETSEISNSEQLNQLCNGNADDIYQVWGQIVNDWANIYKKQKTLVQVVCNILIIICFCINFDIFFLLV